MESRSPLILILVLTGVVWTGVAGSNRQSGEFEGSLDIRIHPTDRRLTPPAELLLVDPQNRKAGCDARTDWLFSEIPSSSYEAEGLSDDESGAPGPETRILHLGSPVTGEYSLVVTGTDSGEYHLEIRGYDQDLNPSHATFLNVGIENGAEHWYEIRYSRERGSKIKARRLPVPD